MDTLTSSTCLGCGCACDDIELHVEQNRIVEARSACPLGLEWFGDGTVPARALVRGVTATLDEALAAAAAHLSSASRALVFLAPDVSCEAQRGTVAVADVLQATLDSVTSMTALDSVLAAQEYGRASATLGEIRNRADVVVFWGVDPSSRYPRFLTRYAPAPAGLHVADGRRSRTVVAVDVGTSRGPDDADLRVPVTVEHEVETLAALTAAVQSDELAASAPELAHTLVRARYLALVADAEPGEAGVERDSGRSAALITLAQALNHRTRCALMSLRAGGNRSGADACVTAQTGYPCAVDFARGYPRYRPYDSAADRLARGGIDAALVVGSAAGLPSGFAGELSSVPVAVIGPRATEGPFAGGVAAIDTGVVGIHESGTVLRMDDVPLPMAAALSGPPAAADVVRALVMRLTPLAFARAAANR